VSTCVSNCNSVFVIYLNSKRLLHVTCRFHRLLFCSLISFLSLSHENIHQQSNCHGNPRLSNSLKRLWSYMTCAPMLHLILNPISQLNRENDYIYSVEYTWDASSSNDDDRKRRRNSILEIDWKNESRKTRIVMCVSFDILCWRKRSISFSITFTLCTSFHCQISIRYNRPPIGNVCQTRFARSRAKHTHTPLT
jgi:hypothetical protein